MPENAPLFPGEMTFDQKLLLWQQTKTEAAILTAREQQMRAAIFGERFAVKEGVQNFDLGKGWTLKGETPYRYSLANKEGETRALIDRWTAMGGETKILAERLVSWSPELKVGEWRKLPATMVQVLDASKVLTIKPGLCTMEIIEPKGA